jgi:hypothetical protein
MSTLLDLVKWDSKASQVVDSNEAPGSVAIKAGGSSTMCATVTWSNCKAVKNAAPGKRM